MVSGERLEDREGNAMQISRKDLEEMEVRGILAPGQGEQLWQALRERGAGWRGSS